MVADLEYDIAAGRDTVRVVAVGDEEQGEDDDQRNAGDDENAVASVGVDFVAC